MNETDQLRQLREQVDRQQADLVVMRLLLETLINRSDHGPFISGFRRRLDDTKATLAEQTGMQDMLTYLDQKADWVLHRATSWLPSPPPSAGNTHR